MESASQLHQQGYVLLPRWRREDTTVAIADSIGRVLDIETLLPMSNIPTVQTLIPKHRIESHVNRYSGNYGLGEFPLHTDLAHWIHPPRYFMLRCRVGSPGVVTSLLACSALASRLSTLKLRRAIVRPRHRGPKGIHCLLPLVFHTQDISGFRWDPLFLIPMNKPASQVAHLMATCGWKESHLASLSMSQPGDTLIVDNWRILHNRGSVSAADMNRRLERIYLSEIFT